MTAYLVWFPEHDTAADARLIDSEHPKYAAECVAERRHADLDYPCYLDALVLDGTTGELHAIAINIVPIPSFECSMEVPARRHVADLIVRGLILAVGGEQDV